MFTGLIQGVGRVLVFRSVGEEAELQVALGNLGTGLRIGDSVSLSGACCTLVGLEPAAFLLSAETLRRTWFRGLSEGRTLNLEPALRLGDPLGGHLVQGHVDGVGHVRRGIDPVRGGELEVEVPADLQRYCVAKGSLTVDGVSLTIARAEPGLVTIAVIPHTAEATTLGVAEAGDPVNLEVDVLGKYVESLLAARFPD